MKPEQLLFEDHLQEAGFQVGVDKGMWGILRDTPPSDTWPNEIFWVKPAKKANGPERYYISFNLTSYPSSAPTATFWDVGTGKRLLNENWPTGDQTVTVPFNKMQEGLYLPCDRLGRDGKLGTWNVLSPSDWWYSDSSIELYLGIVFRILNAPGYANY